MGEGLNIQHSTLNFQRSTKPPHPIELRSIALSLRGEGNRLGLNFEHRTSNFELRTSNGIILHYLGALVSWWRMEKLNVERSTLNFQRSTNPPHPIELRSVASLPQGRGESPGTELRTSNIELRTSNGIILHYRGVLVSWWHKKGARRGIKTERSTLNVQFSKESSDLLRY